MFSDDIIISHIQDAIDNAPDYVVNGEDFRLQKGIDAWNAWNNLKVDDSLMSKLLSYNYAHDYKQFDLAASSNPIVADMKEKMFRLIAYFDGYASNKKLYNEYPDFRVVAGCQIRQNAFIINLLRHKAGVGRITFSVQCLIDYISDPENNFAMVSESDMRYISDHYLGKTFHKASFAKELKEKFDSLSPLSCKNPKNNTWLYSRALYIHKLEWRPEVEEKGNHSTQSASSSTLASTPIKVDMAWIVGATTDKGDGLKECLENGIWKHNFSASENTTLYETVKDIAVGDRIVIKAACTRKKNLPFEINGGTVSVNKIKAYGTVLENDGSGISVKVRWEKVFSPFKEWYFYTSMGTLWKVERSDSEWRAGALLDFIFNNDSQDYQRFLNDDYYKTMYGINGSQDGVLEDGIVEGTNKAVLEPYSKENFLSEVYMTEQKYEKLKSSLLHKKNIILQGPCGVGKTFAAKRLAYSILGVKDTSKIESVQFHQSYSYEDFVQGYRPSGEGFVLSNGLFYDFCKKAESDPGKKYFFIIDEINRGNLSKIFGELLMLLEKDYRGKRSSVKLSYSKNPFSIPENLYVIGMMNTADRSLAIMDYALRRRFAFFEFEPAFDVKSFMDYCSSKKNKKLNKLIDEVKKLNEVIKEDDSLGKGFMIGHSYFCTSNSISDEYLQNIVEYEIIPLLEEYWFDEESKLEDNSENLRRVVE